MSVTTVSPTSSLESFLTVRVGRPKVQKTGLQWSSGRSPGLRRAFWAGLIAVAATAIVPVTQASAAAACAPAWSATAVYPQGNSASQNGHNYTAKWWTQNESPATHSGQWDVWSDAGACGGATTPPP